MNLTEKALIYAAMKHSGQTRKNGTPYIWHPIRVAQQLLDAGYDEICQAAGLLHDVLEDTDATEEELLAEFGTEVTEIVKLLTKRAGLCEQDYIAAILADDRARAVKNCDRLNNLWDCVHTECSRKFALRYIRQTRELFYGRLSVAMDKSIVCAERMAEEFTKSVPGAEECAEKQDESVPGAEGRVDNQDQSLIRVGNLTGRNEDTTPWYTVEDVTRQP